MPRRNRVTPFGELVAIPERGTLMGNRGVLVDDEGRIRRTWRLRRWIVCLLGYKGRWRQVGTPGRYTELFFLDEATALAAGHRPCAECQRGRFEAYRGSWASGNPDLVDDGPPRADVIDDRLHSERLNPDGSRKTFEARLDALPDGVFVTFRGENDALLVRGERLVPWSPGGYLPSLSRPSGTTVSVLTPESTVKAIRTGYVPQDGACRE